MEVTERLSFSAGGADGADSVVTYVAALAEIYLPWRGFNGVSNGIVPSFSERKD